MGAQGTTFINFGSFPGAFEASVAITGQTGIVSGSCVAADVLGVATADHSIDEHMIDPPFIRVGNIVAGTGFTIYGYARDQFSEVTLNGRGGTSSDQMGKCWGLYTVAWAWN